MSHQLGFMKAELQNEATFDILHSAKLYLKNKTPVKNFLDASCNLLKTGAQCGYSGPLHRHGIGARMTRHAPGRVHLVKNPSSLQALVFDSSQGAELIPLQTSS
ncbi:MAG: hypothetical protein ACYDC6_13410 [Acidobacteriaceae bacterium]